MLTLSLAASGILALVAGARTMGEALDTTSRLSHWERVWSVLLASSLFVLGVLLVIAAAAVGA